MDRKLNLDELIDVVKNNVSLNCKLPYKLGNDNIERIIKFDALRYFYSEYKYALQKTYYYVDFQSFMKKHGTGIRSIYLPDEIETIKKIYLVNYNDMYGLNSAMPGTLSLGMTAIPFIASLSMGEFGESLAVSQGISDALAQFSKNTLKFDFNGNSKLFEVHTQLRHNLILEVYAQIPEEDLFGDIWFIKYVTGMAIQDYSIELSFTDQQLAGNTKINTDRLYDRGEKLLTEVKEHIQKTTKAAFFVMVR
jgi:hypothetical protein